MLKNATPSEMSTVWNVFTFKSNKWIKKILRKKKSEYTLNKCIMDENLFFFHVINTHKIDRKLKYKKPVPDLASF